MGRNLPGGVTMFDSSGELDEEATSAHLDRLISEGAHGIVVGGTSGEFISLTDAERRRLIDVAVRAVAGRVPLIVGTGCFSTAETLRLTDYAAVAGVEGAIIILPYYQRPSEAEVLTQSRDTGAAQPVRSGMGERCQIDVPTVHQVHELRAELDDGFRVFYGSLMAPLEGLAGGAHGWISGILNVATHDAVHLRNAMQRGDLAAARVAWARILPIKYLYTPSRSARSVTSPSTARSSRSAASRPATVADSCSIWPPGSSPSFGSCWRRPRCCRSAERVQIRRRAERGGHRLVGHHRPVLQRADLPAPGRTDPI